MWSNLAAVAAVGGFAASVGSVVERLPGFLAWRLARSLKHAPFRASHESTFSDLSRLLANASVRFPGLRSSNIS